MNAKKKWMGKVIQDQSQWGHKKVNVIKSMCDLYICVALLSMEIITCIHEISLSIVEIMLLFTFSSHSWNITFKTNLLDDYVSVL